MKLTFSMGLALAAAIAGQDPVPAQNVVPLQPERIAVSSLVGWWKGERNCRNTLGVNHGFPTKTVAHAPGRVGYAFQLDGATAFIEIPDSGSWNFGARDFSIDLWACFDAVAAAGETIFLGQNGGASDRNKWFFGVRRGALGFLATSEGQGSKFVAAAPFQPAAGEWNHVAVTRADDLYTLYINGAQAAAGEHPGALADSAAPLTIGQAGRTGFMKGRLDEIRIHRSALTDCEVRATYESGLKGASAGAAPSPGAATSATPAGILQAAKSQ